MLERTDGTRSAGVSLTGVAAPAPPFPLLDSTYKDVVVTDDSGHGKYEASVTAKHCIRK